MICRCVLTGLLLVLLGYFAQSVCTEPGKKAPAGDYFASITDEIFDTFLAETESERQLLDAVVIGKEEEVQIGETNLQDFLHSLQRKNIRVVQRSKDASHLKSLVAETRPLMRNANRYFFISQFVAEFTPVDARAFPGGFIVCSTGLIDFAQSETAFIGVLAHEMSRVDRGHQLRTTRNIKLAESILAFRNVQSDDLIQRGSLLMKQFAHLFRTEEEATTDLDAAKWVFETGYDPLELASLFRRLHRRDPANQVRLPSFLRTHPYHAEVYHAVKELSSRLKVINPDERLCVGRENLRHIIPIEKDNFLNERT